MTKYDIQRLQASPQSPPALVTGHNWPLQFHMVPEVYRCVPYSGFLGRLHIAPILDMRHSTIPLPFDTPQQARPYSFSHG